MCSSIEESLREKQNKLKNKNNIMGLLNIIATVLLIFCSFTNVENAAAVTTYSANSILIEDITLNKTKEAITVGQTSQLVATVAPGNATTVTWTSSDTTVATVSATGIITAIAPGNATITAKTTKLPMPPGASVLRADFSNTTYYVSYSDGNDNNTGLSESSPWKTLDKVSSQTFQPGNAILFKSGDTWDGTVRFYGSGTKESPINVGSYGTGGKPVIHGQGAESNRTLYYKPYSDISGTLEIIEGNYWRVSGLEITNHKSGSAQHRVGIFVVDNCSTMSEYNSTPQHGITIDNCYIHDVVSDDTEKRTGGIVLMGNINDVLIDNNLIENVSVSGIRNVSCLWSRSFYLQNYKVTNNVLKNIVGDGVVFDRVENGIMEYNYVNGYCTKGPLSKYHVALWTWDCKDILIQYNEITGGGSTKDDGTPFDVDFYNINVVIQYNYTHNNQKGIAMFIRNSKGTVFRYNVSINDGQKVGVTMFPYSTPNAVEAPLIHNNIIYQSSSLKPKFLFNNYIGENELYVKFYNNILIVPNTLKLSELNRRVTGGKMDGNIFVPSDMINNSASLFEASVYGEDNSMLDRASLLIPDIGVNTEPTGLITGYNTFDVSKLRLFDGLGKIFKPANLADISNGIDIKTLDLGSVSPATVDFFGNPLYNTNEKKTATCAVTVSAPTVAVTGVTLNQSTATLTTGNTLQLSVTVAPANATNKAVTWASSNPAIATVSAAGLISTIAPGSVTITITTADGNKTAFCNLLVSYPTGIDNVKEIAFRVYPSVVDDFVHVNIPAKSMIRIYNLSGVLVKSVIAESNENQIHLSDLNPGMYIIRTTAGQAKILKR